MTKSFHINACELWKENFKCTKQGFWLLYISNGVCKMAILGLLEIAKGVA